MRISYRRTVALLFAGDLFFFTLSLYVALFIRAGKPPQLVLFQNYALPFSLLFLVWVVDFYIAGLYDKATLILKSRLPSVIFQTQVVNSVLAALLFYFFPVFGVTPKLVLAIYLVISFLTIRVWRIYGGRMLAARGTQRALLIGDGCEMKDLYEEVNSTSRYPIRFVSSIHTGSNGAAGLLDHVSQRVEAEDIKIIAIDFGNRSIDPLLPHFYNLMFSRVRIIDSHDIYEDVFDRIPLSLLTHCWFLENISVTRNMLYDILKRTMDIAVALVLGLLSLVLYPFIYAAIKLDDGWKIFIYQDRVGQNDRPIRIMKFRSMSIDDNGEGSNDRARKVTRVGRYIRASRIDELPQLWNVLWGDLSLIGPRPELPGLVSLYEKEIPFYRVRHLIKPGLSGWAQLYDTAPPKYGIDYDRTRSKLSYDLYYVKNRSFVLDVQIALKTVKELLMRKGT